MNFLRNQTLTRSGAFLLGLMALVLLVQHFVTGSLLHNIEEAEQKIGYTRSALLVNHKISLQVQHYLDGDNRLRAEIAAALNEQEYRLKVLSEGGRIEDTEHFIKPLSRLPRITFRELKENWDKYKSAVGLLIGEAVNEAPATPLSDSVIAQPVKQRAPVKFSRVTYEGQSLTLAKWYDKLILDIEEQLEARKQALAICRNVFLFLNIVLLGGLFVLLVRQVVHPLRTLGQNVLQLKHTQHSAVPEIRKVAENINHTIENLKDATDFVSAIGRGDLSIDYKDSLDKNYAPGSNGLADSLIQMQQKLRQLNEDEQKRQWANEGLAKFVDIMRSSNDNLSVLGDKIVSTLVNYTRSNQGALYYLNDEDNYNQHLELISLFAFDIKKHEQQKIKPGQGILGQAFLEKDTTYLTALPEDYIRITSGLGGSNPKSVLIVPLKVDQNVYGLVELASFHEFQPHEIAFVEKLAETIGSALANVRAAQKNRQLIEQFQEQTEVMRAQEEEMRQNMEELQATQEEVVRKEKSYLSRIQELEEAEKFKKDPAELIALSEQWAGKERELQTKIQQLEQELEKKPARGDDWAVAEELDKALRINLEALKITQEELNRKRTI